MRGVCSIHVHTGYRILLNEVGRVLLQRGQSNPPPHTLNPAIKITPFVQQSADYSSTCPVLSSEAQPLLGDRLHRRPWGIPHART